MDRTDAVTSHKREQIYCKNAARKRRGAVKTSDNFPSDDVIASLANAHENRRARQVTEWERMRGTQVHRAA